MRNSNWEKEALELVRQLHEYSEGSSPAGTRNRRRTDGNECSGARHARTEEFGKIIVGQGEAVDQLLLVLSRAATR